MQNNICCKVCGVLINDLNWLPCCQRKNNKICNICYREWHNKNYHKNRDGVLERDKIKRKNIKLFIFNHYGNKCDIYSQTNIDLLSIDHIDGNGRQHRKEILGIDSGTAFYKWVSKNLPTNLRLLCFNCNCQVSSTSKNYKARVRTFEHYKTNNIVCCAICQETNINFLTIDHINEDGAEHRRQVGVDICAWLKKNDYPRNFQLLCFNCNYLKYKKMLK